MREPPAVSVVTPVYNGAGTIGQTIRSVLDQTLANWELIVVDDGSTDETVNVVKGFTDRRIRLVSQDNRGPSVARNVGAELATSPLLSHLDADDMLAPAKLADQVAFLERNPGVGATYCAHRRIDEAGVPWSVSAPPDEVLAEHLLVGFPFNPSAFMVRREYDRQVSGFDDSVVLDEDRDYWLRIASTSCAFRRTPGVLVDYRMRARRHLPDPPNSLEQVTEVLSRHRALAPEAFDDARRVAYRELAFRSSLCGHRELARQCYDEFLSLCPGNFRDEYERDDFLQAIVDATVRTRGDHLLLLEDLLRDLPDAISDLRSYTNSLAACGFVLRGVREMIWERPGPATESFDEAKARGAELELRTRRLVRYELLQVSEAYGATRARAMFACLESPMTNLFGREGLRLIRRAGGAPSALRRALNRLKRW